MIGYDSDNLDDIPSSAQLVNYYDDGEPGSATPAQLSRFPTAFKYSITRKLGTPGFWADIESGTMSIADGVNMWRAGQVQGLYVAESNWLSLRQAIASASLPKPPYWVAEYPYTRPINPSVPSSWIALGCVMWQFSDPPQSGGHYDLSVTAPGFPFGAPFNRRRLLSIGLP